MERGDKSQLPPSGRYSSGTGNSFMVKTEPSSNLPPLPLGASSCSLELGQFGHGKCQDSISSRFNHDDISRMPDNPRKHVGHRRAHSEILTLPDDISFDSDLGVVGGGMDGPSLSDETEEDLLSMYLDMDKFNSSSATSTFQIGESSSAAAQTSASINPADSSVVPASNERPRIRHQHSQSMDGSTTINHDMLISGADETSGIDSKKSMSAAKLAELSLIDPKRAKRIWANRQSAARSKERKMRYISELEWKVKTLQTEATTLSAQLTLLQRDTNGLTVENGELKLRLQTTEQQVHLQDALNDALKEEIHHLKVLTGQSLPNGGGPPIMNFPPPHHQSFGTNQQFFPSNHAAMNTMLTAQQFQQLQIHTQKQQQQQHQLHHQFQPQQMQQHQHLQMQPQPQEQTGEVKMRSSIPSPTHTENSSETYASASRD